MTRPAQGLVADVTTFKRSAPPSSGFWKLGDTAVQRTGKEAVSRTCDEVQVSSQFPVGSPSYSWGRSPLPPFTGSREPRIGASCWGGTGREGRAAALYLGLNSWGEDSRTFLAPDDLLLGARDLVAPRV